MQGNFGKCWIVYFLDFSPGTVCVHIHKLISLYILNMWSSSYINYTSTKLLKSGQKNIKE